MVKHYHYCCLMSDNNVVYKDAFYSPYANLTLQEIIKHNKADLIMPNTLYDITIYKDGSLYIHACVRTNDKGDVFCDDGDNRYLYTLMDKDFMYRLNHFSSSKLLNTQEIIKHIRTTPDVEPNCTYKVLVFSYGVYVKTLTFHTNKNGNIRYQGRRVKPIYIEGRRAV